MPAKYNLMKFSVLLLISIHVTGCVSQPTELSPPPRADIKAKLSPATIDQIQRGVTTKNDVIGMLGSPNIVTQTADGSDVWHYSRMQIERYEESAASGTGVLPSLVVAAKQSKAFAITSSRSFDLVVTFNAENKVEDFKSVTTQF